MDSYLALEKMLLILCADLAIIIGASRVFGWLFGKVGQPPVVGERVGARQQGRNAFEADDRRFHPQKSRHSRTHGTVY